MKRILYTLLLMCICANIFARTEMLLRHWDFAFETESHTLPTTNWQSVQVPHDWAITGPFSRNNDLQFVAITQNFETIASAKTGRTGGLPYVGQAWYKTSISVGEHFADSVYTLLFDGAMSEAEVYINGEKVIFWPYGYNAFHVDITSQLHAGENDVWVRLQNLPQSSRWYPGAGLFRNIHLIQTAKTYIPLWSPQVITTKINTKQATLNIRTAVETDYTTPLTVAFDLYLGNTKVATKRASINPLKSKDVNVNLKVSSPHLWSPESPTLYTLKIRLLDKSRCELDVYSKQIGIRTVSVVPQIGFKLNEKVRKFQGVCLHHDLGPLGAAVHRDAIKHQLTMLKDMGADAIRTSHNMPAPELIELCDSMGFMVMVEPFDEWDVAKCKNGYHRFFNEIETGQDKTWAERDMINMLHQFRNNPSVVMWSIGNEVPTQCEEEGYKVAKFLQDICNREDGTRPITCGMDQVSCVLANGFAQVLEVVGLNYRTFRYQEAYDKTPQKLVLGSETSSTVSSRGVYKLPLQKKAQAEYDDMQSSSYDVEYCSWSNVPDEDFALQEDYPWTIGQFVWTGFDYLGEPSPYDTDAWPSHSSYFGIIDLASIPKDRYYLYRSQWNKNSHTLHILPHWNWSAGDTIPVMVYTDYPEAELFLNGKSLGKQHKLTREEALTDTEWGLQRRFRLIWDAVPYEAGELKVIAYDATGKVAMTSTMRTAEAPHHIELTPTHVGELTYVRIQVKDANGTLCPDYNNIIHFAFQGDGEVLGLANGDPTCVDAFQSMDFHAFNGQMTVIIRGEGTLSARTPQLGTHHIEIK